MPPYSSVHGLILYFILHLSIKKKSRNRQNSRTFFASVVEILQKVLGQNYSDFLLLNNGLMKIAACTATVCQGHIPNKKSMLYAQTQLFMVCIKTKHRGL
jgi:hypothetical protein